MGEAPPGLTLERRENDKGYDPDNCRWATRKEQAYNRRDNHYLEHEGERLTVTEWAVRTGISASAITGRIRKGWPIATALTKPMAPGRRTKKTA
jgi:hypothetical protein